MTKAIPKPDARRRREAWKYARSQCALTHAQVGVLIGKSAETAKRYGMASGALPPWTAIESLRSYNLGTAYRVIAEKFGDDALTHFREMA